ncbi:MAG: hypothetical protein JXR05_15990 [Flavobacteriaceae bacterium]
MNAKVSRTIFLSLLILNILIGLFFGFLPLVNFSLVLEMNQIPYSDKLIIFGVVSGIAILFLAAILTLSLYWTKKGKWEGTITGIIAGFYLLIVGIVAWFYTGDSTALIMDSIRGGLTILFGYRVYKSIR